MRTQRIDFERLTKLSGLTEPAIIEVWLQHEGVAYSLDAESLPWTTLSAIQRALRRRAEQGRHPDSDFALEI